mmetsp:Transcript_41578/g.97702  ORF Transcript_41578/g.97702 Transcript_41578/m.97702 type:complete len:96 (-) Transcript_41578:25-312(-)|eukprot:1742738-Rhodomonas_salina.3
MSTGEKTQESSLRFGSAWQRTSSAESGAKQNSSEDQMTRIKNNSASLRDTPSQWSLRNGLLTSDILAEHVVSTLAVSREETDKDKIRRWADMHLP